MIIIETPSAFESRAVWSSFLNEMIGLLSDQTDPDDRAQIRSAIMDANRVLEASQPQG